MVNPISRAEAYESGILAQLIKNAERLAVIESQAEQIQTEIQKISGLDEKVSGLDQKVNGLDQKVSELGKEVGELDQKVSGLGNKVGELDQKVNVIYGSLKWLFSILGTILLAIIANIFSQPLLNWLG